MIPRNKLVQGLVDVANSSYSDRFKIKYNTKCKSVDIKAKVAYFSDGTSSSYDLLIGADGANSEIRNALATQSNVKVEENILPGQYKVMLQSLPPTLEPDAIHAMECTSKDRSNIGLFLIPAPNNKICALVNWRNSSNIPNAFVQENTDPSNIANIQDLIEKDFPLFGRPSEEAVLQLQNQRPSVALTIKCDNYAAADNGVVILGDAAHSTGGTLGQGANSALMDVVELDKILEQTNDDVAKALSLFSIRQQPEGSALLQLLSLPPKNIWGLPYNFLQLVKGFLSKLLPYNFLKPTQTLLSQTLTPFSKIVAMNKFWLNKV
jgi:kynurenine 3-monooxygenase